MKFENKKNLEKRFTEKERLDKIFSKRIDLVDNLDDFKKIDDLLNKKNSLLKITKLRNSYFISNKKINPINFYYGNLSPDEFNILVQQASQENESLD